MKVYIAAKYGRRFDLRSVVDVLAANGIESTSRWIFGDEEGKQLSDAAKMDIEDVNAASHILFFAEPKGSENTGGGRYFELGYALAMGKKCVVVLKDDHETVFTAMPEMNVLIDPPIERIVETLKITRGLK